MTFWLLNIYCLLFCEFLCTLFFIRKSFRVAVYEGPHRATDLKKKKLSKYLNILSELIHNVTLK